MILTIEIDQYLFEKIDKETKSGMLVIEKKDRNYPYHKDSLWVQLKEDYEDARYKRVKQQIYIYTVDVTDLDEGMAHVNELKYRQKEASRLWKMLKKREHFIKQENGDL